MNKYLALERNTLNMIIGESFVQILNGSLMLVLFLYMGELNYTDQEKAFYFIFRFVGSLIISFPLGLYIKGKRLVPFFKISSILTPIFTVIAIYGIANHIHWLIGTCFLLWGLSFSLSQICKIPFTLRHCPPDQVSRGITLCYSTWSFGNITGGVIIFVLSKSFPDFFDSQTCLLFISGFSLFSFAFFNKIDRNEKIPAVEPDQKKRDYDWLKIFQGLFPTLLIAMGAGMSIPFMNLYFESTFDVQYDDFALLGFATHILVFTMILNAPWIKEKMGYGKSIPITQTLAVSALILIGVCEDYSHTEWAFYLAVFFFVIRQPLMNIAQPMTTEIVMQYVGPKNHEITSGLFAMIWSGSFFITGLLFGYLRGLELSYFSIFMVTAAFYGVAILWYIWLIQKIKRQNAAN